MFQARRALARTLTVGLLSSLFGGGAGAHPALGAPAAWAADPPRVLTLDEAVREALDRNLTLVAERYSIGIAKARILTAGLRPNPVLTYSAMLPDGAIYDNNVNPLEQVVRADVLIEGGGKRARRIDVAEQTASVADLQLVNAIRMLVLDVQDAFVDVLLAKANAALARESLSAFNELVRVNTERVRTGDLSQVELYRSRLAALQFQNDVRQQESKLAIARHRLQTLVGGTAGDAIDADGDFRHDAPALGLDAIEQLALDGRPDLKAARHDEARAAADIRLQVAQGAVDYTVSGELHRQQSPHNVLGNEYGVYVSAPLPIFNRNQGEVERARQESRQAEAHVQALEADVRHEVVAAFEQYAAARDIVSTIETQMLAQARDVRTTTEYSYRRGEASFVELLDAVRAFNDTMQSYNEARADYARSLYTLDSTSGKVTP